MDLTPACRLPAQLWQTGIGRIRTDKKICVNPFNPSDPCSIYFYFNEKERVTK